MERKKKYHGGLFLFFATLCALLFINTFSYASEYISQDYIDYCFDTLSQSGNFGNNQATYVTALNKVNRTQVYQTINSYIENAGLTWVQDRNLIVLVKTNNVYGPDIYFTFSNVSSAPDDIGFLYLSYYDSSVQFGSYQGTIYYTKVTLEYISSANRFNMYWNSSMSYSTSPRVSKILTSNFNYTQNNTNTFFLYLRNCAVASPTAIIYSKYPLNNSANIDISSFLRNYSGDGYYFINNNNDDNNNSGDSSSTGTITNPSGDITGQIDLSGIEQGIGDINNNLNNIENKIPSSGDMQNIISGEVSKITNTLTDSADNTIDNTNITSGDIVNSLGFSLMENPYQNFWYAMTQGLSSCLTDSVRSIPVDWLGFNGYFNLDGLINYPSSLKTILTTVSTVAMVWWLVKWWKIIIDKLTSGNVEEVLEMNEEERHN